MDNPFAGVSGYDMSGWGSYDDSDTHALPVKLVANACVCGSGFCESCVASGRSKPIKRIQSVLKSWRGRWAHLRHITLTIDRSLFESAESCYRYITRHKFIPQYLRDLGRYGGVSVVNWMWVLEWHQDGFPHWHLLIDVAESGIASRIGHDKLSSYWRYGGVYETYFKSQSDYDRFFGYFSYKSYFGGEDKGHQIALPDWALDYPLGSIRKMGRKVIRSGSDCGGCDVSDSSSDSAAGGCPVDCCGCGFFPVRRTYRHAFSNCGRSVLIRRYEYNYFDGTYRYDGLGRYDLTIDGLFAVFRDDWIYDKDIHGYTYTIDGSKRIEDIQASPLFYFRSGHDSLLQDYIETTFSDSF